VEQGRRAIRICLILPPTADDEMELQPRRGAVSSLVVRCVVTFARNPGPRSTVAFFKAFRFVDQSTITGESVQSEKKWRQGLRGHEITGAFGSSTVNRWDFICFRPNH